MENIKVKKEELLTILKKNRENHRVIFLEALDGFRKKAIVEFEKQLEAAKAGKKFDVYINLTLPHDQTKDYDRAIGMLSMSVEDVIELSEHEYQQYVMDDWSWKMNFLTGNSTYSGTAAAELDIQSSWPSKLK